MRANRVFSLKSLNAPKHNTKKNTMGNYSSNSLQLACGRC